MAYSYCNVHNVSWDGQRRDYCRECMERERRALSPCEAVNWMTDEEIDEAGMMVKTGNDDRHLDCYSA